MTHDREKSDPAIVAGKSANKMASASAQSSTPSGRSRTKLWSIFSSSGRTSFRAASDE